MLDDKIISNFFDDNINDEDGVEYANAIKILIKRNPKIRKQLKVFLKSRQLYDETEIPVIIAKAGQYLFRKRISIKKIVELFNLCYQITDIYRRHKYDNYIYVLKTQLILYICKHLKHWIDKNDVWNTILMNSKKSTKQNTMDLFFSFIVYMF